MNTAPLRSDVWGQPDVGKWQRHPVLSDVLAVSASLESSDRDSLMRRWNPNATRRYSGARGRTFDGACRNQVSVVLATYNGAAFLVEQLESIATQTRMPDELVVSDDASEDSTLTILEEFATTAPFPVRVIRNDRRVGYAGNFERALRHCRGEYVFFSDQDDVWLETKVERVVTEFERRSAVHLVIHDLIVKPGDLIGEGRSALKTYRTQGESVLTYVAGCATAVRRPLLEAAQPFPRLAGIGHDTWLHMLAHQLNARAVMEEALTLYRRHGGNATVSILDPDRSGGRLLSRIGRLVRSWKAARSGLRYERLAVNHALLEAVAVRLGSASANIVNPTAAQSGAVRVASDAERLAARIEVLYRPILHRPWAVARLATSRLHRGTEDFHALCLDLFTRGPVDCAPGRR